jgi:hypothetical protein
MSDGSQLQAELPVRPLRNDERELLQSLLSGVYVSREIEQRLAHAVVQEMSDGGMGSIRFVESTPSKRRFGREIAAVTYIDEDGTPVDITVNLDQEGRLFEVDIWKVDFSPLTRYPRPDDLKARGVLKSLKRSEAAVAS